MPKTIITTSKYEELYTLDEMLADEKLKAALIEKQNLGNDQLGDWDALNSLIQYDANEIKEKLEERGYRDVELNYDLSYCQGSGASFDFEGLYLDKLVDHNEAIHELCGDDFPDTLEHFFDKGIQPIVKSCKNAYANHYCHSRTRYIDLEDFDVPSGGIEYEITTTTEWKDFQKRLEELIQADYIQQCETAFTYLRRQYEYYQSEEYTINELKENCTEDTLFYKDGRMFTLRTNETLIKEKQGEPTQYVVLDQDGKLLSRLEEKDSKPIFIDSIDDEDEGYSKAIKYHTELAAYKAIASIHGNEVHTVKQVFKGKEEENGQNGN